MSADQSSGSKLSSTDDDEEFCEENFIESLTSQVDGEAIDDLIRIQKRALERFEKTNEMLATCRSLTEKRLEDAKKQFLIGKELINQSKADLESVFQRLRNLKARLADRYPEIYVKQLQQVEEEFPQEEDD